MYSSADFEIIKDAVVSAVPLAESVYLFGSYAKGLPGSRAILILQFCLNMIFTGETGILS